MSRVLVYLGRFAAIVFGFFCASLAASAFMHLLILGGLNLSTGGELEPGLSFPLLLSIPFVALVVGYLSFLPAVVPIVLAEIAALRGWLFHALSGAAVVLAVGFMRAGGGQEPDFLLALAATGLVGGIAYWVVAGRNAGLWLNEPEGPTAPRR